MAGRISEDKINEVREASDIVDVVSEYMTLKKSGRNYFGLCPFHTEKTASFSVNSQLQIFHCFGCNAGGNVFTFIMKMEGVGFPAAVRRLAQRAGISIPEGDVDEEHVKQKEALYHSNRLAAEFFYRTLMSSAAGEAARRYLGGRGLDLKTLGKFGLGYAPDSWDGLIGYAASKSVRAEALFGAGLVLRRDDGRYYDRFRNRAMFPIFDVVGHILGFGGRRLADDDTPKYINSPETAVYKKSTILYGLYQTKGSIRKNDGAVIVEGYTDLLSLYQNGIGNVIATAGTALTEEQGALLRRYTENVVILYDADSAGASAALRGADLLIKKGLNVAVSRLPGGYDPDSYVRAKGGDALRSLLSKAETLINFKIVTLRKAGFFSTTEKKNRAIHSILESIAVIPDEIKRNLIVQETSELLDVDGRLLMNELQKIRAGKGRYERREVGAKPVDYQKPSKAQVAEELLLRSMLVNERIVAFIFEHLQPEDFHTPIIREMVAEIYDSFSRGTRFDPTKTASFNSVPQIAQIVAASLSEREKRPDASEREARVQEVKDNILNLLRRPLEEQINSLRKDIKALQSAQKDVSALMKEYQSLKREITGLDNYWHSEQ